MHNVHYLHNRSKWQGDRARDLLRKKPHLIYKKHLANKGLVKKHPAVPTKASINSAQEQVTHVVQHHSPRMAADEPNSAISRQTRQQLPDNSLEFWVNFAAKNRQGTPESLRHPSPDHIQWTICILVIPMLEHRGNLPISLIAEFQRDRQKKYLLTSLLFGNYIGRTIVNKETASTKQANLIRPYSIFSRTCQKVYSQ
jgi:hypothetical protein